MRVLKVMHDKTTSTKLQGKGTNHKSLQKRGYKNKHNKLNKTL